MADLVWHSSLLRFYELGFDILFSKAGWKNELAVEPIAANGLVC